MISFFFSLIMSKNEGIPMRRYFLFSGLLFFVIIQCTYYSRDPFDKIDPAANIELTALFSDHMVLQQGQSTPVWGKASPGGKVLVKIAGQRLQTVVDQSGSWRVDLAPMKPAESLTLRVIGQDTVTIQDVAVGEVWICSGQSNMEWPLSAAKNGKEEVAAANYKKMRLFTVEKSIAVKPMSDVNSDGWHVCTPETAPSFSAVAYFFGRELVEDLNIPIGLIHTSWGGTPAEAWTSAQALKTMPDFGDLVKKLETDAITIPEGSDQDLRQQWTEDVDAKDLGLKEHWERKDFDDAQWSEMQLPTLWESAGLGGYDGVVWFRKTIDLPQKWAGGNLKLHLGPIDDVDSTWVNGHLIGSQNIYNEPRKYKIPQGVVNSDVIQITVRILDTGGGGGIWGKPDDLKLYYENDDSISLAGNWKYKLGVPKDQVTALPNQNLGTVLYNAMLAPLIPYGIQGAIWYQGESNAGQAYQYRTLFPTMIRDWRSRWKRDFPFLFVQLANYGTHSDQPRDNDWAELREAQLMTLSLPNTGMAVTIDIGNPLDIHPRNKQDVGKRLALNARALVYGEDIPYSGPIYRSMTVEGNAIRLAFDHVYQGLSAKGDTLTGFAIAGEDRKFIWANATADGVTILVSEPKVQNPVAVRYGWDADPHCNLVNSAGLPASPFRTDQWPGVTQPK